MKRLFLSGFAALALALVFSSCGITYRNREVNRFLLKNESVLYEQYGRPWNVQQDSKGRKVLTFEVRYTENVQTEGTSWTDSSGVTHHSPPSSRQEQHVEHRIFVVDQTGRVVKATWKLF